MKFFGPPRPERVLLRRNTLYVNKRCSTHMEPLWKVINTNTYPHKNKHVHIHMYIHIYICIYTHKYTCIYKNTCMYMCVCVCVCVCAWEREGREGRGVVVGGSVGMCWCVCVCCACCFPPQCPSTASLSKANDWRTRERVVLDLFSNLTVGNIQWLLSVNLSEARDNSTWAVSW